MGPQQIIKAIKKHSKFLITSHINLEPDALGSELALASLLRKWAKTVYIVNHDKTPSNYSFLPGVKKIRYKLDKNAYEVVFVVDCSNKQRIGKVEDLLDKNKPIINIDHHFDNKRFGEINWIDAKASSAAELIYRLFKLTKTKIDTKDALNIYAAILTDTGSFRHCNTTQSALSICSRLLTLGVDPAWVYSRIYENNSVQQASYLAKTISNTSFTAGERIACAKIGRDIYRKIKGKPEILDKILDFGKSVSSVKVVAAFCQLDKGVTKLCLRSKRPVDVQRIALAFGGGGHKFASGCIVKGSFKQVEKKLIKQVRKQLT